MRGSRRFLLGAGALVVFAVVSTLGATSAAPEPATTQQASPEAVCGDLDVVGVVNGSPLCTYGEESADEITMPTTGGATPDATPGIECYGNGQSGARVQVLYAYFASNRVASLTAAMRTAAADVEDVFDDSAARTGGHRHVRWLTDESCNLTVTAVPITAAAVNDFNALTTQLSNRGYHDVDRKYLVYVDTYGANPNFCSGLGSTYPDASSDPVTNMNNLVTGYARAQETCLGRFNGTIEAHELMHTLGAVQRSAPHSTGFGHCTDEYDRMCYVDGPGVRMHVACAGEATNDRLFDCNNDDYFYANRPCGAGGYLLTHWNTADSRWTTPVADDASPPGNDAFANATLITGYSGTAAGNNGGASAEGGEPAHAGNAANRSVWFRWVPPVAGDYSFDTCGTEFDTVLGVYTGSAVGALTPVASADDTGGLVRRSRVTFTATADTNYYIAVDGKVGAPVSGGAVRLRWGAPASGFTDVPLGAFYEPGVNWAKEFALVSGFPGNRYKPKDAVNRGQMVNMLWNLMGQPSFTTAHPFTDVPADAFYDDALSWAKEQGLVSGFTPTQFRPKDPVTRGQIVNMIWNMVETPSFSAPHGFPDVPNTAFYDDALSWAKEQGLVSGFPNGTYHPRDAVNRGQAASILFNLASRPAAWASWTAPLPPTVVF